MNDDDLTLSFEINSLMMLISDYQGQFRLLHNVSIINNVNNGEW